MFAARAQFDPTDSALPGLILQNVLKWVAPGINDPDRKCSDFTFTFDVISPFEDNVIQLLNVSSGVIADLPYNDSTTVCLYDGLQMLLNAPELDQTAINESLTQLGDLYDDVIYQLNNDSELFFEQLRNVTRDLTDAEVEIPEETIDIIEEIYNAFDNGTLYELVQDFLTNNFPQFPFNILSTNNAQEVDFYDLGTMYVHDSNGNLFLETGLTLTPGGTWFLFTTGKPDCESHELSVRALLDSEPGSKIGYVWSFTDSLFSNVVFGIGPANISFCLSPGSFEGFDIPGTFCSFGSDSIFPDAEKGFLTDVTLTDMSSGRVLFQKDNTTFLLESVNATESYEELLELINMCHAVDLAPENQCNIEGGNLLKLSFFEIPFEVRDSIQWTISKIDTDSGNLTHIRSGKGTDGCGVCVECGTYIAELQNCDGTGTGGGFWLFTQDLNVEDLTPLLQTFTYAATQRLEVECPAALPSAPTVAECDYNFVRIDAVFDTDNVPEENLITVVDMEEGQVVKASTEGFTYCLDVSKTYTVNIIDCGGNGICCSNGYGNFALLLQESTLLDSVGSFGYFHSFYITQDILAPLASAFPSISPTIAPTTFEEEFVEVVVTPSQLDIDGVFEVAVFSKTNRERVVVVDVIWNSPFFRWFGKGNTTVIDGIGCTIVTVTLENVIDINQVLVQATLIPIPAYEQNASFAFLNRTARSNVQVPTGDGFIYEIDEPLPDYVCYSPSAAPSADPSVEPTVSPTLSPTLLEESIDIRVFPLQIENTEKENFEVAVLVSNVFTDRIVLIEVAFSANQYSIYSRGSTAISSGASCVIVTVANIQEALQGTQVLNAYILPASFDSNTDNAMDEATGYDFADIVVGSTFSYSIDEPLPNDVCYAPTAAPSASPTPMPTFAQDSVIYRVAPTQIVRTSGTNFEVAIYQESNVPRVLVVDIVGPSPGFNWFGKGVAYTTVGDPCVVLNVTISFPISNTVNAVTLSAYLVSQADYDSNPSNAWSKATANKKVSVTVGSEFLPTQEPLSPAVCFPPTMAPVVAPTSSPTTFAVEFVRIDIAPTQISRTNEDRFDVGISYQLNLERYIVFDILSSNGATWYGGFATIVQDGQDCLIGSATIRVTIPSQTTQLRFQAMAVPVSAYESNPASAWRSRVATDSKTVAAGSSITRSYTEPLQSCQV